MATKNAFILLAVMACLLANATATRELAVKSGFNVPARGETRGGGLINCFLALMEFQFCSDEVFLIPLRGHPNLSPVCCHAITTIANRCWPSVLASLGLSRQGDVQLHRICGAATSHVKPSSVVADSLPKHLPPRTI
jgi:hypothetical protein